MVAGEADKVTDGEGAIVIAGAVKVALQPLPLVTTTVTTSPLINVY